MQNLSIKNKGPIAANDIAPKNDVLQNNNTINSAIAQLYELMAADGIVCNDEIIADGVLHRFINHGDRDRNSWYVLYPNKIPTGSYGCWKLGITKSWCSKDIKNLSKKEKADYVKQVTAAKELAAEEKKKSMAEAAKECSTIFNGAHEIDADHKYLKKKGVLNTNILSDIKQLDDELIIPIKDVAGNIKSLQYIMPTGNKRFHSGGEVKGNFFIFGNTLPDHIFICEGVFTGFSIHEVTQKMVVAAFSAGNLLPVAQAIREKYPSIKISLCADDDRFTADNPGLTKAREAAQAIGASLLVPNFSGVDLESKPTDFNDLMLLAGVDEAKRQLLGAPTKMYHSAIPANFRLSDDGLYYIGGDHEENPLLLCSPLEVSAYYRDIKNEGFGLLVEFEDRDHIKHRYMLPASLLEREDCEYRAILASKGLRMSSNIKAQRYLKQYLKDSNPTLSARLVYKTGWYNNSFVIPNKVYGEVKERLLLETESTAANYEIGGTLEDWRGKIAASCANNSRLVFALSCAFAAPLLNLTGDENGGFHLRGASSTGKTTLLKLAACVWGSKNFLHRWRATTNGLEGLAAIHNDTLLCLDELAQVDPREAGAIAYMLANGTGKQRATRSGMAKEKLTWRLLFLSSGETSLSDHMAEAGKRAKTGQEVRLVEVEADAGVGRGVFEDLHGYENPQALAKHLTDACTIHYGVAADNYLSQLINMNESILLDKIKKSRADFIKQSLPAGSHGQVARVADRFALIACAGELATEFGITGWKTGEAIEAANKCFKAWLNNRGGVGSQEIEKALQQVKHFFELHGDARFASFYPSEKDPLIRERAGFKDEFEFYVFPEVFKHEICEGLDWRWVAKLLIERGWLKPDSQGKSTCVKRVARGIDEEEKGSANMRLYHFTNTLWED